jgi:hypothetical protein
MIENEDSVVTSLNELRKLKNERISRQTQSRSISVGNRAAALAEDPLADQMTPPPAQGLAAMASHAAFDQNAAFAAASPNRFAPAAAAFDHAPMMSAPPVIRTKTSYTAAVVMSVLLIGAGGAGYMKLQQDTQSLLAAKEASIKSAEEARMRSVEAAAKTDQQTRANLRQCEDKLKTAMAAAVVAPSAPAAAAAPVVEKKSEKPAVASKASRGSRHVAARSTRAATSAAPKETAKEGKDKSGDVPTIAKKKKVNDDPLAGLGKL